MLLTIYDFTRLTTAIHTWLTSKMGDTLVMLSEMVMVGLCTLTFFVVLCLILVYMERKVSAFMQIRMGPNRVGPWGTVQAIADTVKLLLKEGLTPDGADKLLFNFAPILVVAICFAAMAPIAFGKGLAIWDINIGVLYISAISSVGVIGILMAGWSSNNKYSLLGAMRSGAQIVSYELSIGMAVLSIVVLSGSLKLSDIIMAQESGWWIFRGHIPAIIAFIIFIIASTAEINRAPFDMAEAESELTAGFHAEYSGMKFAMFFLAEYVNMFIVCAIGATLFFGGWMPFHIGGLVAFNNVMDFIPSPIWFFGKTFGLIFLIMWFRWTFPRLRIDQLLTLEWKFLLPISMINLLLVTLIAIMGWYF